MHIKIIQNHFTVLFQMKSAADLRVCSRVLSYRMPTLLKAATVVEYKYDIGFSILNEKTLLLSGYLESDFEEFMDKLAKSAGTVFDALFRHVQNPPSTPVSGNTAVFVSWVSRHRITFPFPVERNLN